MIIAQFKTKQTYGVDRIYPVNPKACKLVQLTGKKTVNNRDLQTLHEIGIIVMLDAVELHVSNN